MAVLDNQSPFLYPYSIYIYLSLFIHLLVWSIHRPPSIGLSSIHPSTCLWLCLQWLGWGDAHLLYELVRLLHLEGAVLQWGGGPLVDLQPLLVGRLADLRHSEAQSAQPCNDRGDIDDQSYRGNIGAARKTTKMAAWAGQDNEWRKWKVQNGFRNLTTVPNRVYLIMSGTQVQHITTLSSMCLN